MENNLRESFFKTKDPYEEKYLPFCDLEFDYEINNLIYSTKLKEDKQKNMNSSLNGLSETFSEKDSHYDYSDIIKNLISFNNEKFNDDLAPRYYRCEEVPFYKKNYFKALISNKRIRLINKDFDLDLIYITKRVMAMGYPATGCESLYRNTLSSVKRFFQTYHNNLIKVYNLCIETEKIYSKNRFPGIELALFPFSDHQICPVKLMLEFCVDLILYLTKNPEGSAAVHCKAGKGRTGVMICCYLIFSGIASGTDDAIHKYTYRRSYLNKGVEIASQKRYINHFDTFLSSNFNRPYFKMIPKIIKYYLNPHKNILLNIFKDKHFSDYKNIFKLYKIKIGPFKEKIMVKITIQDFLQKIKFDSNNELDNINFKYYIKQKHIDRNTFNYIIVKFNSDFIVENDINIKVNSKNVNFNLWINFFYITLEKYFDLINEIYNLDILKKNINNYSHRNRQDFNKNKENVSIKKFDSIKSSEIKSKNIELTEEKSFKDKGKKNIPIKEKKKLEDIQNSDLILYLKNGDENINDSLKIIKQSNLQGVDDILNKNISHPRFVLKNSYSITNISKDPPKEMIEKSEYEIDIDKIHNVKEIIKKENDLYFYENNNSNNNIRKKKGNNNDFYSNEKINKHVDDEIFKSVYKNEDENKYSVLNENCLNSDEFKIFNCDYLYDKLKNGENFTDNLNEELKKKLLNMLFESVYDANYYWRNKMIYNNDFIIKFLRENSIIDNNLNCFQYLDLKKIFNLMLLKILNKPICSFFRENKRFKLKFDAFGVDKFGNKKKMMKDFQVLVKYNFE